MQDMLPILAELRRAIDMQMELEALVENGNYFQVGFQYISFFVLFKLLDAQLLQLCSFCDGIVFILLAIYLPLMTGISIVTRVLASFGELFRTFCYSRNGTWC